jgi:hypothetical protein
MLRRPVSGILSPGDDGLTFLHIDASISRLFG